MKVGDVYGHKIPQFRGPAPLLLNISPLAIERVGPHEVKLFNISSHINVAHIDHIIFDMQLQLDQLYSGGAPGCINIEQ